MQKLLLSAAAAALLAAAPLAAVAQSDTPAGVSYVDSQKPSQMLASTLIGTAVQNSANENVGDINDVVFDEGGTIEALIIGVGGFLGVGEKAVGVPYEAATMKVTDDKKRVVMINTTKDALEAATPYAYTDKKTLNDRWRAMKTTTKETYDKAKKSTAEAYNKAKEKTSEAYDAAKKNASEAYEQSRDAIAPDNAADGTAASE